MTKRMALAGYPVEYFKHFADHLTAQDYEIFWICGRTSDAEILRASGVDAAHILDTNEGFQPVRMPLAQARTRAAAWESADEPCVNDIIMMDRLLCRKEPEFALRYMAHIGDVVADFLQKNSIEFVTSWRDTALQLMTMLVCKKVGIPYVVPTRARLPQEMYMFCTSHHTEEVLFMRAVSEEDRAWAVRFLAHFRDQGVKPSFKRAARGFRDVIRLLPDHLEAFLYEAKRERADHGNNYTRYSLRRLIFLYLQRKVNMAAYKLFKPAESVMPEEKFALYALHTQPESSIDVVGSFFSDQIGLVRMVARSLPATHALYVKVHPTDMDGKSLGFYRALKRIPGVRLVDYAVDSRSLLMKCDFVFALTGTIAYEAALLGKPVISFARNFFNPLPLIRFCDAPMQLSALVREVLAAPAGMGDGKEEVEFLAKIRSASYDGEVSRFNLGQKVLLTAADLAEATRAYDNLFAFFCLRPTS